MAAKAAAAAAGGAAVDDKAAKKAAKKSGAGSGKGTVCGTEFSARAPTFDTPEATHDEAHACIMLKNQSIINK